MMKNVSLFLGVVFLLSMNSGYAESTNWLVKKVVIQGRSKIVSLEKSKKELSPDQGTQKLLRSLPRFLSEDSKKTGGRYEEWLYTEKGLQNLNLNSQKISQLQAEMEEQLSEEVLAQAEVRVLVSQGDPKNRIDLTILGDGYTLSEKQKFFDDATRTMNGLFHGKTFASYLPLFNVYAVFVPSKDSGITDLTSKNTAFGLYRDPKGSKRAIIPGKEGAARRALQMAPDTDYPLIIANDDYYGGLGGEFAISTRSERSGLIVLRHELGHNFSEVGEEYDGGYVYEGANFSSSSNVPWKQWSTESKVYETHYLNGEYLWKNLKGGKAQFDFNFPSGDYTFSGMISSVGWETSEDVFVLIDGERIEIKGDFTNDRTFFTAKLNRTLSPGRHTITFQENIADGDNVLAFAMLYALPADYNSNLGNIAAYATFRSPGDQAGYRPTHETCLMRDMLSTQFCSVDQENMWFKFLDKVSLIDQVVTSKEGDRINVEVKTPQLSDLEIHWYKKSSAGVLTEIDAWKDKSQMQLSAAENGLYEVSVHFRSKEVRLENPRLTVRKEFEI